METATVSRSVDLDGTGVPLAKALECCRYFSRLHYENLQILSIRCCSDMRSLGDALTSILPRIRFALMPGVRKLILHDGKLDFPALARMFEMENPPRIYLRNVTICRMGFGSLGEEWRGLDLHAGKLTIDLSQLHSRKITIEGARKVVCDAPTLRKMGEAVRDAMLEMGTLFIGRQLRTGHNDGARG